MYTPPAFDVSDPAVIRSFVRHHSFGIVISTEGNTLHDTHTPMLISDDSSILTGHLARANPQWRSWPDNPSVKALFHGPHAYISPRYYQSDFNVPTWNYAAVSVTGSIEIVDDRDAAFGIIRDLVARFEGPSGWKLDPTDERYMKLLDAVVCFSIRVEAIEAKFKMNQNKTGDDRRSVVGHLLGSSRLLDQETGAFMRSLPGFGE
jgi:transcriptional regulator